MTRLKDDVHYQNCYIFGLPDNAIIPPDFRAVAVLHVHMIVTRDYFSKYDKWYEDLAHAAMNEGVRLAGDEKIISGYERQLREAFDELDHKNAEMLTEALEK